MQNCCKIAADLLSKEEGKGVWKVRGGSVPDFITRYKYALLKQLNNHALLLNLVVILWPDIKIASVPQLIQRKRESACAKNPPEQRQSMSGVIRIRRLP